MTTEGATRLVLWAAAVRAFVISLGAVVLGLRLAQIGFTPGQIGFAVAVGMVANALSAALVAWLGERAAKPGILVLLALLSAAGIALVAFTRSPALVAVGAFMGLVNGMGRDRGGAQAIEQALVARLVDDATRTSIFVRYTIAQDVGGALGALTAGLAAPLQALLHSPAPRYDLLLAASALLMLGSLPLYSRVPAPSVVSAAPWRFSRVSRRRITGLSALFLLDSIGGGFLAGTILTYWFFERFALGAATIGTVFFAARVLNAASYFMAGALARRIGLIRTMVFTHLPTSLLLLLLAFLPSAGWAIALFLLRECLVQMDVPARQSYVAAVVNPHERAAALAFTNLVRYSGWALGPALAGLAMTWLGIGAPLVIGAVLKGIYDLALFASFQGIRPREEASIAT